MGHFYFDESIQEKGAFIVGAYIFSDADMTPQVYSALRAVGLSPGIDEYKSGARTDREPLQRPLREHLKELLQSTRIGVLVLPSSERQTLGAEAIQCLEMLVQANALTQERHQVFFDEGIHVPPLVNSAFLAGAGSNFVVHAKQNSKLVGGIQLADLAAHTLGVMLLEQLGHISKLVRAGDHSGYPPDLEIELGFELWASLRHAFFRAPQPKRCALPDDPVGDLVFDVESYGLHISADCSPTLRQAALARFGECYLGCIH